MSEKTTKAGIPKSKESGIPKKSKAVLESGIPKKTAGIPKTSKAKSTGIPKTGIPKKSAAVSKTAGIPKENAGIPKETAGIPKENKIKVPARANPAKAKREVSSTAQPNLSVINKKLIASLKVIESISHTLGISDNERINFDIEQISENELNIRIVNGTANFKSPWFAIKNEEPYIFMPAEILDMLFVMLKKAQKESFEVRLERAIAQHMPIDFGDVWRVVANELASGKYAKEPDIDKIVSKVRQEHPNLFMDLSSFISGRGDE